MLDKLEDVEKRFEQLGNQLQDPDLANNQTKYRQSMKEYSGLKEIVDPYREHKKIKQQLNENRGLLNVENDEEMREMIRLEIGELEKRNEEIVQHLRVLLIPKDPNDDKNIILEIRPGAGGDESALFAEQIYRAYTLYATSKGWNVTPMSIVAGNVGGVKEVIANITGDKVFSHMKYESGVHRVQRVPKTEASGRVHTSTITVAVLPEAEDVDVKIDEKEIRIDVMRASGSGGQSVNKTESAVRVTHLPTGIIVYCQEGKSQHANKEQAMKVLYSRLLALEEEKARKDASSARLAQIGTGDRSERIRTYNFPQSRITDHRIGLTVHKINELLEGDLDIMIEPLITHYQSEALKQEGVN